MAKGKNCGPQQEKGWFGGGLSKDDKKLLTELKSEVVQLKVAVAELAKVVGAGKPINIQFSWPMDNELMQIVKDIQGRLPGASDGGLTKAEEDALAKKLAEPTGKLKDAVEANQP